VVCKKINDDDKFKIIVSLITKIMRKEESARAIPPLIEVS
jgi:hypothetical protein